MLNGGILPVVPTINSPRLTIRSITGEVDVVEDDGKVMISHTSIMRAASELGLAPKDAMVPVIEETGKRVHKVWNKI